MKSERAQAALVWLIAACSANANASAAVAQAPPQLLTAARLLHGRNLHAPVDMTEYAPGPAAKAAAIHFSGRLTVTARQKAQGFAVLHDPAGYVEGGGKSIRQLPALSFEFVQDGDVLLPVQRGVIAGEHPNWEFILQPGRVWQAPEDADYARASLPFALLERNANCTHYGVMTWLFSAGGKVSRIAYQVSSETCAYFKFDMWGLLAADFEPGTAANAPEIIASYRRHEAARLPTKPISALAVDFPDVDVDAFGAVDGMNPADMTNFGIVAAGSHYRAECITRHGPYPYCESIPLPSYSTAKSVFAGVAMMRLEKLYPGAKDLTIDVLIPECRAAKWSGVRIEDALDMATGNFNDAAPHADENSAGQIEFLYDESHFRKLKFACNEYAHRADAGTQWVYHTSDTYLAGTAMSNLLYAQYSRRVDLYSDFLRPVWQELILSPLLDDTRRSYDEERQPLFGWGLTYEPDDIAKLARWIGSDQLALGDDAVLDARLLAAALQRNPADRGLAAESAAFRYSNGFYAHDIAPHIGCDRSVWVPFMSGYGGISVVLFPNDVIYYYFSDGATQRWRLAAAEINKIKGMCE